MKKFKSINEYEKKFNKLKQSQRENQIEYLVFILFNLLIFTLFKNLNLKGTFRQKIDK